jgi:hypothetical protein
MRISFLVKRCGQERVKGWIHAVRNLAGKDRGRSGRRQAWNQGATRLQQVQYSTVHCTVSSSYILIMIAGSLQKNDNFLNIMEQIFVARVILWYQTLL